MADLLLQLENHRELLTERGYQEIGLGSAEEPGLFIRRLEDKITFYLSDLKRGLVEFDLPAVGFFNDEKNLVNFSFHYELDKRNKIFDLKSFTAETDGITKEFVFKRNMFELPDAGRIVSTLLKEQEKRINDTVHISQPLSEEYKILLYKNELNEHQGLLAAKGYTNKEHFPYSEGFLFKKMQSKFSKRFWDSNERQDFLIRVEGFFNGQNDEVKFNFFYAIDQEERKLQLNAFVAELGEKRICYPLGEANDLPPAINVWKQLTNSLKEDKAEVIYPKEKIKLLLREQERNLGALGYYKTFFSNDSNFIERELQGKLEKSLNEHERLLIPVNRQIHLNLHDTMHCHFQYVFDPVKVQLEFESLTANVGIVERKYSFDEIKDQKLVFPEMFKELKEQNRLLNAKKISEGPGSSGIKALTKHVQHRS